MKQSILLIFLLIPFFASANSELNEESKELQEMLLNFHSTTFCVNSEYINCMGITKQNCIQSFKQALNICIKSLNPKTNLPSPVCITNNYIKNTKVKKETAKSCDGLVKKIVPKHKFRKMPNN